MSDPSPEQGARVCPSCGAENWPSARFCANCGTRLVAEEALERDFDSTVAEVLDQHDDSTAAEPVAEANQHAEASAVPETAVPVEEWPATMAQPAPRSRHTALWIILAIVGFILVSCCVFTLLVTIVSSNDSALHQELNRLSLF